MAANLIPPKGPEAKAVTKCDTFEFSFNWTIEDFLNYPSKTGDLISSPEFGGPTKYTGVKWKVNARAYPDGTNKDTSDHLSVYMRILIEPKNAALGISACYDVSIVAVNKEMKFKSPASTRNWVNDYGFPKYIKREDLEECKLELLLNGDLTLHFQGEVNVRFDPAICKSKNHKIDPDHNVLTAIVRYIFLSGTGSDVIIKAQGQEFNCHKHILSMRSEYFRGMFESGMKESQEGAVDLSKQMNGDELKDLLEYLYLGVASNLKITSRTMLKVANMLGLTELKDLSEQILIETLKPDNAWDIMTFAHEQGAEELEKEAHSVLAGDKWDLDECA